MSSRALLVLSLAAAVHAGETLAQRVEAVAAQSPAAARGHWGAQFIDLESGELLYARNEHNFFVPASNTKLFSTALGLERLGPAHRQSTRLVASRALDEAGALRGELRLIGAGDATLNGRALPYDPKAKPGDPLSAIEELAAAAWKAGLRRVEGPIVGDDSAYLWEPYPEGWSQDDTLFGYGAPVSALMLHDNTFSIRVTGADEPGEPAHVTLVPSSPYWSIESRIRTVAAPAPARVHSEREPGSRQVELWGTVAAKRSTTLSLAVDDPAYYAAFALREALVRQGVSVDGGIVARHRHPLMVDDASPAEGEGVELARRLSPPLIETLRVINKVSQNLQAEALLLEVARQAGKPAGRDGALASLREFMEAIGVPDEDFHFEDGSGLSRLTLFTPATVVRLLRYMHGSRHAGTWVSLLPRAGVDGTLELRFKKQKGVTILAKTGSLSHTATLSGYLDRPGKSRLAFSVMVNNANTPGAAIREFIDKLIVTVVE